MYSTLKFQWDPEDYAHNSGGQLVWARELLAKLKLSGNESILDVGCGDGKVTAKVAEAVPEGFVLGIDSSNAFIEYARSHYPREKFPNLEFAQMDARNLSYNRLFDAIISNATLHWVDDHRAFLRGCKSLLKREGRLVLSCGGAGNASEIIGVVKELMIRSQWQGYFKDFSDPYCFYSTEDYRRWLTEAGLRWTRLELAGKDMVHKGRDGLVSWIRTTWMPYTYCVPEDLRNKFIMECVDNYLKTHPLDNSGNAHVKMVRLEVEAHL